MQFAGRRSCARAKKRLAPTVVLAFMFVTTLAGASAAAGSDAQLDRYGGFDSIDARASGRFRVERIDDVWWFVDPEGHGFFSSGVNVVNPAGDFSLRLGRSPYLDNVLSRYGSERAWAKATRTRLRKWGVNTVGAFSIPSAFRDPMPYTVFLQFSQQAPIVPKIPAFPTDREVRDYLGPWFAIQARAYALDAASGCARDPWCIGVYTDNEPPWGRTVRQSKPFLFAYMGVPAGVRAKVELQRFLSRRYDGDVARFNTVWGTGLRTFDDLQALPQLPVNPDSQTPAQRSDDLAFRNFVAKQYFKITHDSLRAVSKDFLILGPRFDAQSTPADIYEIAGEYVDVVSLNNYEITQAGLAANAGFVRAEGFLFSDNPWNDLDTVEELAERPLMISEFSYRSRVPGGPQGAIPPAFPYLPDQEGRARRYREYMAELYRRPFVIGAHWFQYMDQPASGRGDGQDSNWGLVDIEDRPWPQLVAAVTDENRSLPDARLR